MAKSPESAGWTQEGAREAIGQSEAFLAFEETLSRIAAIDRPARVRGGAIAAVPPVAAE